jgi:hypothetical protein
MSIVEKRKRVLGGADSCSSKRHSTGDVGFEDSTVSMTAVTSELAPTHRAVAAVPVAVPQCQMTVGGGTFKASHDSVSAGIAVPVSWQRHKGNCSHGLKF